MILFKKIISFFRRYLFKHPVYTFTYIFSFFLKDFSFKIHFYSQDEMVKFLREGKSILRFGDGDMVSVPLDLQHTAGKPDERIKKWYRTIVAEYQRSSPYILSIPRFLNLSNEDIKKIGPRKFNLWLPVKVMFLLNFNKKVSYMDSHNFYYDNYFEKVVAPVFYDKKIIFVVNKVMADKQRANINLPWKDIVYVEAPPYNAIDAYDEIVSNINNALEKYNKKDIVLFIAIGPVAKHLVYEYAHKGYQSIDLGRYADVMFTGESIQQFSI